MEAPLPEPKYSRWWWWGGGEGSTSPDAPLSTGPLMPSRTTTSSPTVSSALLLSFDLEQPQQLVHPSTAFCSLSTTILSGSFVITCLSLYPSIQFYWLLKAFNTCHLHPFTHIHPPLAEAILWGATCSLATVTIRMYAMCEWLATLRFSDPCPLPPKTLAFTDCWVCDGTA